MALPKQVVPGEADASRNQEIPTQEREVALTTLIKTIKPTIDDERGSELATIENFRDNSLCSLLE